MIAHIKGDIQSTSLGRKKQTYTRKMESGKIIAKMYNSLCKIQFSTTATKNKHAEKHRIRANNQDKLLLVEIGKRVGSNWQTFE